HAQRGDKDRARTWFDRASRYLEEHPTSDEAPMRYRAEVATRLGVALMPPRSMIQEQVGLANVHSARGRTLLELGRRAEALEAFPEALEAQKRVPLYSPYVTSSPLLVPQLCYKIGQLHRALNRPEKALPPLQDARDILRRLVRENPSDQRSQF